MPAVRHRGHPGNFGPIVPGANSGNLAVTFNASSAGPLTPLSGQVVHVRSNFENLTAQGLAIATGAGAAVFQVAQPTLCLQHDQSWQPPRWLHGHSGARPD